MLQRQRNRDRFHRSRAPRPVTIVAYVSQFMTLEPGDVIATGTPAGVAMAADPPGWLAPGDVLELSIDGLGQQRQRILPASPD